jgi:hypothetical protein
VRQPPKDKTSPVSQDAALELVREALASLSYGQVVITVHDGQIALIERTEKMLPPRR